MFFEFYGENKGKSYSGQSRPQRLIIGEKVRTRSEYIKLTKPTNFRTVDLCMSTVDDSTLVWKVIFINVLIVSFLVLTVICFWSKKKHNKKMVPIEVIAVEPTYDDMMVTKFEEPMHISVEV